jgi:hypothetical protein
MMQGTNVLQHNNKLIFNDKFYKNIMVFHSQSRCGEALKNGCFVSEKRVQRSAEEWLLCKWERVTFSHATNRYPDNGQA